MTKKPRQISYLLRAPSKRAEIWRRLQTTAWMQEVEQRRSSCRGKCATVGFAERKTRIRRLLKPYRNRINLYGGKPFRCSTLSVTHIIRKNLLRRWDIARFIGYEQI